MHKALIVAVALLALGLGGLMAARIHRQNSANDAPKAPVQSKVEEEAIEVDPRGLVGVIFPRQQVDVASSVSARVEDVKVQLGARIQKGDVVATLDSASIRRELAAAQAAVRAAQAAAKSSTVELEAARERAERLSRHAEAVAGEERINAANKERLAGSQVSASRARVAEAVARVEQLKVMVEHAAIVAPFDGVISARYVDPGAMVNPGQAIARLISADDLWVRFAIPEDQAGVITVGGCVDVRVESPEVAAVGVVEMVAPQVDTELRMLTAEARLTLPDEWKDSLQAGLAARVHVASCTTN